DRAARHAGWRHDRDRRRRGRHARARGRRGARPARRHMGQRHGHAGDPEVSADELLTLVTCDLGAIVRGRSLFAADLGERLKTGVSWVPANHALTPLGPLAEPNPFGSTGDPRPVPDPGTRVRVAAEPGRPALEWLLCDIVETYGRPWECCPRRFLRDTLQEIED